MKTNRILIQFWLLGVLLLVLPAVVQAQSSYNLTVSVSPSAGGSVVGTGVGARQPGTGQIWSAIANNGYTFGNWTANGVVVSSSPDYTFYITNDVNLVANFIYSPYIMYIAGFYLNNSLYQMLPNGSVSKIASGFNNPTGLAVDGAGNVYVANSGSNTVSKVTPAGAVSTFASGFITPTGLAIDAAGNVYVVNAGSNTVSKVTPAGVVSTFASGFSFATNYNGGTVLTGLGIDGAGNLYVANSGSNTVSKVTPAGVVSTYASGFNPPAGLAVDGAGYLYVSDPSNKKIWKITPSGVMTSFTSAIWEPVTLALDGSGNLYVMIDTDYAIWEFTPAGGGTLIEFGENYTEGITFYSSPAAPSITSQPQNETVVVGKTSQFSIDVSGTFSSDSFRWQVSTDGGATWVPLSNDSTYSGTSAAMLTVTNTTIAMSGFEYECIVSNTLGSITSNPATLTCVPFLMYVSSYWSDSYVAKILPNGVESTFVDGLYNPELALDDGGNLYMGDGAGVYKVTPAGGMSTLAIVTNGDITALAVDASGNVYAASESDNTIQKITPSGMVSMFADGFADPSAMAFDANGNLYVADYDDAYGTVSKISSSGVVSIFATGVWNAEGMAIDRFGNLYVGNNAGNINKITPAGVVSIFATGIYRPRGLAFDGSGNLYVAEEDDGVFMITPTGVVTPFYTSLAGELVSIAIFSSPTPTTALTVSTDGMGFLSTNYNGVMLQVGNSYAITATAGTGFVFINWTGGTSLPLAVLTNGTTVQFVMEPNLMLQANFVDLSKPTISITNVPTGLSVSNAAFTVKGTTSDNWQVTNVFYSLNNTGWNNALTTNAWTNWYATVNLAPGTNTIAAYAVDPGGDVSLTTNISLFFAVTNQLQIRTIGLGSISPNYSNAWLQIGRNYSITSSPASGFIFTNWVISINWIGSVTVPGTNLQFMMQSNLTLQANFIDTNKPVLSITNLTGGQRWSNVVFTAKGSATDNWQVASVQVQLNGGIWTNATGTTNWAASLTLMPGTNTFAAYATDTSGNNSTTNAVNFDFVVTNQLQIRAIGKGTISPTTYSNGWLEIGRNYSITSAPATGFVFTNWTVSTNWNGGAVVTGTNLQFMMQSNLALLATFVETSRPTLTITAPTNNQHMMNALAYVTGTNSDNWGVTGVWYRLNSNAWNLVTTTTNNYTNWTQTVTLLAGTNTVNAYALNLGGNFSITNSVKFVSSNTFALQLVFTNSQPIKTNGLVFNLLLSTGLNGHIQVSTNLTSWATLTNFVGTNATITFRDPAATNSNHRFYRAVIP